MNILVQKFGGTSVSSHERRLLAVKKILNAKKKGYNVVVVVSAMGRNGYPYATDTLLSLVDDDFKSNNPLAVDLLLNCGEIISTVVMCCELNRSGINCIPLSGGQAGIITDNCYNNASTIKIKTDNILSILKKGMIPVVAGFQGVSEDGFATTLGRGGSDVTAALLGSALKAESIEIYTDVDGIMTADPRIVSDASLIKKMSYDEVFQFADQGAKVIHPRAVEIARKYNIPLVIKNTLSNCDGTIINSSGYCDSNNTITGITSMKNRIQINIKYEDNKSSENYINILNKLAEHKISIDLINVFPNQDIFTIGDQDYDKFDLLMDKLNIKYTYIKDCSKISIIGSRMRGIPGIMAKILNSLNKAKVEVLQTADSHTTIWCLVRSESEKKAIIALHNEFNL